MGGGGMLSFRNLFGGSKKAKGGGGLESLPEESSARGRRLSGRRPSSAGDAEGGTKQRRGSKIGGLLSFRRR